jgi:cobalt-zinc-cadmium efflux system protein
MTHHHGHNHGTNNYDRAFAIGITLNLGFVFVEATYGILAHSTALLADAGHNTSDILALVLAWGGSVLKQRRPSTRYTYGLRSSSILISLLNAISLLLVTGAIAWEAIQQLQQPSPVVSNTIIWVAAVGIVINTATALLFISGSKQDLNLRGAFLHMTTDALVSLGVVLAGIVIAYTSWFWLDPLVSLIVSILIVVSTWQLLKDSLDLALAAVPEGIEPLAVRTYLTEQTGVTQVHDLHIWGMSTTETALTAHLVMPDGHSGDEFLAKITHELHDHFGIEHTTVQIEMGNGSICHLESDLVV